MFSRRKNTSRNQYCIAELLPQPFWFQNLMVDFFSHVLFGCRLRYSNFSNQYLIGTDSIGDTRPFTIMEVGNGFTQDLFPLASFEHFHDYGK